MRLSGPQRIVVVANPRGHVAPNHLEALVRRYMPGGSTMVMRHTRPDMPIHGLIEDDLETATVAIASGGDGTVSQVAAAILEQRIPLGIIPAGSTNMVAKVSNIPASATKAVELIFGNHRREWIDVGRSGERLLLHLGGAGLDARIFIKADPRLKKHFRWGAYLPAMVSGAFANQTNFTVTVDDQVTRARSSLVLVANSAQLLSSRIHLVDEVSRSDGQFDVLIYTATNPVELAWAGIVSLTGYLEEAGQIIRLRGRSILIESDPPAPAELDGEVVGTTPLAIEVLHQAIDLIRG